MRDRLPSPREAPLLRWPEPRSGAAQDPPSAPGALLLGRQIGQGGMGVVWEAWHPGEGVTVAVKVMTVSQALREQARAAFSREVEAIARMDHPHIVRVHDHGRVDAASARLSGGRLQEGQPYLVMELATAGTLVRRCGRLPWDEARRVLRALLQALAHAHARGVVHLDLKPENVLLGHGDAPRLADFGLAQALGEAEGLRAGTPAYMAPEQIRGERLGPWTDLYALGHLGWTLVHGGTAYWGEPSQVVRAQLSAPLPDYSPVIETPGELEGWLRRLLQRRPAERFTHAADALASLDAMGAPRPRALPATLPPPAPSGESTFLMTEEWELGPFFGAPAPTPPAPLASREPPPLAPSWADEAPDARPQALEGLGLRTFGLREVPLVGREAARDQLWSLLQDPDPVGVLVYGPAGSGRRLLLRWLAHTVETRGAALALRLESRPLQERLSRRMAWTHLSTPELTQALAEDLFLRRDAPVDEHLVDAALEWLRPGEGRLRLGGRAAEQALAARLLSALAAPRRLLLVVDEADEDGMALGRALLAQEARPGVLLVVVAGAWPGEAALALAPPARRIQLHPFEADALRALLTRLIRLDFPLAERLVNASNGNLEYLLEVVRSWIAQDDLQQGPEGFQLREGASPRLPQGTRDLRERRLNAALAAGRPETREALALLALGGLRVGVAALDAAAGALGIAPASEALRPLERAGIVLRELDELGFVDGGYRELAAEGLAPERLRELHEAWTRAPLDPPLRAERLGEHLLGAGRPEAAAEQLCAAAHAEWDRGDATRTLDILGQAREALALASAPAEDARWGELKVLEAAAWHHLGRMEEAKELSEQALSEARAHGWPRVAFEAQRRLAGLLRMRGRSRLAEALLREALAELDPAEAELRGWGQLSLSQALRHQGRLSEAIAVAGETAGQPGHSVLLEAELQVQYSALVLQTGDLDRAEPLLRQALECSRRAGRSDIYSSAVVTIAELALYRGELEEAERGYRECIALTQLRGERLAVTPQLNLALIAMKREQWAPAREELLRALATLRRQSRDTVIAVTLVFLMACDASLGDEEALRAHLDEAERLMEETGSSFPDGVEWGRLAQAAAAEAGLDAEAERLRRMIDALESRLAR
ncbi:MAG: protein kinase [Alphaproteobacteria bacterium]|nr:protein kinase [Alphaproteobacteria bacterium]